MLTSAGCGITDYVCSQTMSFAVGNWCTTQFCDEIGTNESRVGPDSIRGCYKHQRERGVMLLAFGDGKSLVAVRIGHSLPASLVLKLTQTSALVSRRLLVRIPPENAYHFFFSMRAWESTAYTVLMNLRREGQEIPSLNLLRSLD